MTVPIDEDMNTYNQHQPQNHNVNRNTNINMNINMNMNMPMSQQQQRQAVTTVAGYILQQKLGSGSFATVYKGVLGHEYENKNTLTSESSNEASTASTLTSHPVSHPQTQTPSKPNTVAIKAIDFKSNKMTKKVLFNLDLEISILTTYQHPNIVCLNSAHKTDRYIYLLLEYCAGGDLQGLIRSRRSGRLSEGLSRRLMRDLTSGLTFLAEHNLIHRDIKPQNLLLTGILPIEELVDNPGRDLNNANVNTGNDGDRDSSEQGGFHLKIADFGFARHLKKTSLADTLCGSPLYMAPEILQHRSYDSKADLWSVGTVLFEMIAGRPPFHGENHMDLLRNINTKAVRLPPDLKVSKECVKLLRILLNRNPLSRAGFQEFIQASDAFVSLGCLGEASSGTIRVGNSSAGIGVSAAAAAGIDSNTNTVAPMSGIKNLGPITEVEESHLLNSGVMDSHPRGLDRVPGQGIGTSTNPARIEQSITRSGGASNSNQMMSPESLPLQGIDLQGQTQTQGKHQSHGQFQPALIPLQSNMEQHGQHTHAYNNHNNPRPNSHFAPLEPSPPGPRHMSSPEGLIPPMSLKPPIDSRPQTHAYRKSDSQHSHSDDSSSGGFVMVEKGSSTSPIAMSTKSASSNANPNATSTRMEERKLSRSPLTMWKQSSNRRVVPVSSLGKSASPPASPRTNSNRFFSGKTLLSTRNMIPPAIPFVRKGMLSTSPGTGGALLGMMGTSNKTNNAMAIDRGGMTSNESFNFESATKMLAAADDVGRRAINVAHVGDTRAYLAMRLMITNENTSMHSSSGMESLVEETDEQLAEHDEFSIPNRVRTLAEHDEFTIPNRVRTISADQSASRRHTVSNYEDEDEDDEMPFAMPFDDEEDESLSNILAVRKSSSDENEEHCKMTLNTTKSKSSNPAILSHFRQALTCYMKALSMLKSSVNASQQILSQIYRSSMASSPSAKTESFLNFKSRCDVSHTWLTGQFKGVLERADAASAEIAKITSQSGPSTVSVESTMPSGSTMTVEELIYNHSLACGKDGAVKQLLGQYDNARSCYRSAGLLAETLLMEPKPKLVDEDRKVLEEYVQGFSDRINEIDCLMLQQSRHSIGSIGSNRGITGSNSSSRRGSGNTVVPLVGPYS